MSTAMLCYFLISSVFYRIFLIVNESIMLVVMSTDPVWSFASCLIQLVMEFFLIRRHSVPFYIILLLLFITSCISLQMFAAVLPVLHSDVFLTSQRYLLCAVIVSYCSNSQLLVETHSWLSACLIFLDFVVLTDVTE